MGSEMCIRDSSNTYQSDAVYLGTVYETDRKGRARIEQRNKFCVGDVIEIMKPDGRNVACQVLQIQDDQGEKMESAPHPKQELWLTLSETAETGDLLRTIVEKETDE